MIPPPPRLSAGRGCASQLRVLPRNPPRRKVLCLVFHGGSRPSRVYPRAPLVCARATGLLSLRFVWDGQGQVLTINPFLSPVLGECKPVMETEKASMFHAQNKNSLTPGHDTTGMSILPLTVHVWASPCPSLTLQSLIWNVEGWVRL